MDYCNTCEARNDRFGWPTCRSCAEPFCPDCYVPGSWEEDEGRSRCYCYGCQEDDDEAEDDEYWDNLDDWHDKPEQASDVDFED